MSGGLQEEHLDLHGRGRATWHHAQGIRLDHKLIYRDFRFAALKVPLSEGSLSPQSNRSFAWWSRCAPGTHQQRSSFRTSKRCMRSPGVQPHPTTSRACTSLRPSITQQRIAGPLSLQYIYIYASNCVSIMSSTSACWLATYATQQRHILIDLPCKEPCWHTFCAPAGQNNFCLLTPSMLLRFELWLGHTCLILFPSRKKNLHISWTPRSSRSSSSMVPGAK